MNTLKTIEVDQGGYGQHRQVTSMYGPQPSGAPISECKQTSPHRALKSRRLGPAPVAVAVVGLACLSAGWMPSTPDISGVRIQPTNRRALELLLDSGKQAVITASNTIMESALSGDGKYVAALVLDAYPQAGHSANATLRIWSNKGPIARIPNVQRYAFSPNSHYIAFIVGQPFEGGLGFIPQRVEILDLFTLTLTTAHGLEKARDISWARRTELGLSLLAEVDSKDIPPRIVRYNLANGQVRNTQLMGLHCSPDGEYYILTAREAEQAGLCQGQQATANGCIRAFTWNNRPVELPEGLEIRRRIQWANRSGHELLLTRPSKRRNRAREAIIVDIATGSTRVIEHGGIDWSWRPRKGRLILKGPRGLRSRALQRFKARVIEKKRAEKDQAPADGGE